MVVLVAFLASCGSSAASSGTDGASVAGRCGPAAATTLASSHQARVYSWHGGVFGCTFAQDHPIRLGSAARSIREARVTPVALAGVDAAYGLSHFGIDTGSTEVVVLRLTDGKQLQDSPATRAVGAESFQSVGSIVVNSSGAVAWIGVQRSIIAHRGATEVHEAGAGGDHLLESGPRIDPASLRLHGTTLTWLNGGATRHATLR